MDCEFGIKPFRYTYPPYRFTSLFGRFRHANSNWFAIQLLVLLITLLSLDKSEAEEFSDPLMGTIRAVHDISALVDAVTFSPLARNAD